MDLNEDAEILRRLGIISDDKTVGPKINAKTRSAASPVDDGSVNGGFVDVKIGMDEQKDENSPIAVTASEGDSDDNCDVIFDKQSLLGNRPKNHDSRSFAFPFRNRRTMASARHGFSFKCSGFLVATAFFNLGVCISIIGPTIPDLQSSTHSESLVAVVSLVSSSALGSLLTVSFGSILYAWINAFILLTGSLFGCALTTFLIPWCTTLTTATFVCFVQGLFLGVVEKCGCRLFGIYFHKKYKWFQLFYVAMALGAFISPLITTPFVFGQFGTIREKSLADTSGRMKRQAEKVSQNYTENGFNSTDSFDGIQAPTTIVSKSALSEGAAEHNSNLAQQTWANSEKSTSESTAISRKELFSSIGHSASGFDHSKSTTTSDSENYSTTKPGTEKVVILKTTASSSALNESVEAISDNFWWKIVSERVQQLNEAKIAYTLAAGLCLITSLIFTTAFLWRCIPCQSIEPESTSTTKNQQIQIVQTNLLSHLLLFIFVSLVSFVEADVATLTTVYELKQRRNSQARGALLTALYWLAVALSRVFILATGKMINSTKALILLLLGGVLTTSVMSVFDSASEPALWMSLCSLGLTTGPVFPLAFCWLDQRLAVSGQTETMLLAARCVGRILGPLITAYFLSDGVNGSDHFALALLVGCLMAGVAFVFIQRTVKADGHLRSIQDFSSRRLLWNEPSYANGQIIDDNNWYRRVPDEAMEVVEMDTFDVDDYGDVIHFNRFDNH